MKKCEKARVSAVISELSFTCIFCSFVWFLDSHELPKDSFFFGSIFYLVRFFVVVSLFLFEKNFQVDGIACKRDMYLYIYIHLELRHPRSKSELNENYLSNISMLIFRYHLTVYIGIILLSLVSENDNNNIVIK